MVIVTREMSDQDLVLIPITEDEKLHIDKNNGEDDVFVLYKLPKSTMLHIGMMSPSINWHYPKEANVGRLKEATSKSFFYNAAYDLQEQDIEVGNRPVYVVTPSDDRTVESYDNLTSILTPLEEIIDLGFKSNETKSFK